MASVRPSVPERSNSGALASSSLVDGRHDPIPCHEPLIETASQHTTIVFIPGGICTIRGGMVVQQPSGSGFGVEAQEGAENAP